MSVETRARSGSRRTLLWALALGYMALIWALSARPASSLPQPLFPHADKLVHFGEFGVLSLLLLLAIRASAPSVSPTRAVALAIAAAVIWGIGDEWHQRSVAGRDASPADAAADALGATTAAILYSRVERREKARASIPDATEIVA